MEIKKNFSGNIGLTLIEVLIAVTITAMVMLYTTSFFIAAWRLSSESEEYSQILNDVVSNLESYKASPVSTSYVVANKTLRKKHSVRYTISEVASPIPYVSYITSEAKWYYQDDGVTYRKISIKSASYEGWKKHA